MPLKLIAVAGALLAACSSARADGFMAPKLVAEGTAQKMVASHRQEALLTFDGNSVTVLLRTHFRAGPEELAWIVPVPAKPDSVDKGSDEVFAALEQTCAPRFTFYEPGGGGKGCSCWTNLKQGGLGVARGVTVVSSGTAGVFQYVVLSATRADELAKWLNDNSYRMPIGAERVFGRYVRDGWHWLAMRLRPEATDLPDLAPHPVAYTYRDSRLVYPLEISQLSADLDNEIVLYVLGRSRFACANWRNADSDGLLDGGRKLAADAQTPSGTNYERLFRQAAEKQQGHLFLTEFAGDLDTIGHRPLLQQLTGRDPLAGNLPTAYLTRLRALMPAKAMDSDVALVPVDWPDVRNRYTLRVAGGSKGAAAATGAAAAAIALLVAAAFLQDRRGLPRLAALLCAAAGCLTLTML